MAHFIQGEATESRVSVPLVQKTTAIVLAGDRGPNDPVARLTGASCKALAPVAGRPMLLRVLDALGHTPEISDIRVVGPSADALDADPMTAAALARAHIEWYPPAESPSASALTAIATDPPGHRVLITSADHALLTPSMVQSFLAGVFDRDLTIALVAKTTVVAAYPDVRRTTLRLRPGPGYCTANLFALAGGNARQLLERWQRLEQQRKHPARYIGAMLGWVTLARYLSGRLTLDSAFERLGRRTGVGVGYAVLDCAEAALDVDNGDDLQRVESILAGRCAS